MKILHLLSTSRWSGAAEPVFLLCRELSRRGHEVHLAFSKRIRDRMISSRSLRPGSRGSPEERAASQAAPTLEGRADAMGLRSRPELRLKVYVNIFDNLHDYFTLRRMSLEEDFDIIHSHLSHAYILAALGYTGGKPNCPKHVHTHHAVNPLPGDPWHRWLVQRRTDHILVHSPEVRDAYLETFRGLDDRVTLLAGGIDLEAFQNPPSGELFRSRWNIPRDCLVVGMAARMQKRRDHATLLRAIARLPVSPEKFRCVLIGRGEYRPELESLVRESGIVDRVVFAGFLQNDYLEALATLDVFVYTAPGSEASCRAVMEAMALGKPVVGVRRAAVPLLVEPERNGFLFEPGDDEHLAQRIGVFMENPALAKALGHHARRKVEAELTVQHLAEGVEQIYLGLRRE